MILVGKDGKIFGDNIQGHALTDKLDRLFTQFAYICAFCETFIYFAVKIEYLAKRE